MSKNFKNLIKMADGLIKCENEDIEKRYGIGYNTVHEFESVLREEIEEAEEKMNRIHKKVTEEMWQMIRQNKDIPDGFLKTIIDDVKDVIGEVTQVGAVVERYRHGIKSGKRKIVKKA